MDDAKRAVSILFATVGKGREDDLEATLYTPIKKSIETGQWDRIVLLPSQGTLSYAQELRKRCPDHDVHIRPLPADQQEYNPEACYTHFTAVIDEFLPPVRGTIAVDITRGTKAMSAALLLAAFRCNVDQARYVQAQLDPQRVPAVVPGTERVIDAPMRQAQKDRLLQQAKTLMDAGVFAATARLLMQAPWEDLRALAPLGDFYAAWDRLDYETADQITLPTELPPEWKRYQPGDAARKWVHALAGPLPDRDGPDYAAAMASRLRCVAVDLWANGLRRIRQHQLEDAVLRGYRVLELIGQARLFDHGLDSASLPENHPAVRQLGERLCQQGSPPLARNKDGTFKAAREQVARLLKYLEDPMAKQLLQSANDGRFSVVQRNNSLLVHGYSAVSPRDVSALRDAYRQLEELIREDRHLCDRNPDREFAIARTPELMLVS